MTSLANEPGLKVNVSHHKHHLFGCKAQKKSCFKRYSILVTLDAVSVKEVQLMSSMFSSEGEVMILTGLP